MKEGTWCREEGSQGLDSIGCVLSCQEEHARERRVPPADSRPAHASDGRRRSLRASRREGEAGWHAADADTVLRISPSC